jgi:hypothetical protein
MMSQSKFVLPLVIALCCSRQSIFGDEFVDTFPLWNGTTDIWEWGSTPDATPTFGQTFTPTASQTRLKSIRFAIFNGFGVDQDFLAFVYAWNGTTTVGPPVFAGPNPTGTVKVQPGYVNYDVDTRGVAVTPGQQYVAFFTALGTNRKDDDNRWAYLGTNLRDGVDAYPGGNFVFNNTLSFSAGWSNPTGFGGKPGHDAVFRLTFVPEPTPAALAFVAAAGFTIIAFRWKRQCFAAG